MDPRFITSLVARTRPALRLSLGTRTRSALRLALIARVRAELVSSPRAHRFVGLPVIALLALANIAHATDAVANGAETARTAPVNDASPPVQAVPALPLVSWRELSEHPGRYTNKRVRIVLQFSARVATWNPYLTRFGTRDFDAFQFWSDEQRLWNVGDYQAPPVRLFARRDALAALAVGRAQPFMRFELSIVVREIFLDQPWAEIESAMPLAEHVSEGTLIHASRAAELIESKSWKLAENELDQALIGALPPDAKQELERLREECRQSTAPKTRPDTRHAPVLRTKPPPARTNP
jgi:hypothetical protein